MPSINFRSIRFGALAITLLLLAASFSVPPKKLTLHPLNTTTLNVYSDQWDNGNSTNIWSHPQSFTAQCTLKAGANYRFCGVALKFYNHPKSPQASNDQQDAIGITGIDLSQYQGIEVDFAYEGEAQRIRIAMRNVEFDLIQTAQLHQAKQVETYIERDEFNAPVFIDFELLNISDWWVIDNGIRREATRPAFNNIMEIILHLPEATPLGQHTMTIKRITAIGDRINRHELYRGLIAFWTLFIIAEMLSYTLYMRRENDNISASLQVLKEDYESLKMFAEQDPLTKSLNRRGIELYASSLLKSTALIHYWLCIFQVDNYKKICDTYGQATGDSLLKDLTEAIRHILAQNDELGRWSGESFVFFSAGGTRQDIFNHCEIIRKTMNRHTFRANGKPIPYISLSFGITRLAMNESFENNFKKADNALQSAKKNGRDQTAVAAY